MQLLPIFLEAVKKFAYFLETSVTPETSSIIISRSSFLFSPKELFTLLLLVVSLRDRNLKVSIKESSSSCSFAT